MTDSPAKNDLTDKLNAVLARHDMFTDTEAETLAKKLDKVI